MVYSKVVSLLCSDGREKSSVKHFLQNVEAMEDSKIETLFKLMPHEVIDLKDAIKRSDI